MNIIGKILAAPVRLVNAPLRIIEDALYDGKCPEGERMPSVPLDRLADGIEKGTRYVLTGKKR